MSTFLDAVNQVLRNNVVLSGDDDDLTSFATTQHRATALIAIQAVKSTLTDVVADRLIPSEWVDATITMITDQRIYSLPADFVRMDGEDPFFLELDGSGNSANRTISEYPGGEHRLKRHVLQYREQSGTPFNFYFPNDSSKKVAFYPVPTASDNNVEYRYQYEKSVYVTAEEDVLPFHTEQEDNAFMDMASRYFKFLFTNQPVENIGQDVIYGTAKAALTNLMKPSYSSTSYGFTYK